jgi:hypothetical protein
MKKWFYKRRIKCRPCRIGEPLGHLAEQVVVVGLQTVGQKVRKLRIADRQIEAHDNVDALPQIAFASYDS